MAKPLRFCSPLRIGFLTFVCIFHLGRTIKGNCGDGRANTEFVINKSDTTTIDKIIFTIFIGSSCYSHLKLSDNQKRFLAAGTFIEQSG